MEGPQAVRGSGHADTHGAEPMRLPSYRLCLVRPSFHAHLLTSTLFIIYFPSPYVYLLVNLNFLLLSTVYVII